jgi:hypothetical protein
MHSSHPSQLQVRNQQRREGDQSANNPEDEREAGAFCVVVHCYQSCQPQSHANGVVVVMMALAS